MNLAAKVGLLMGVKPTLKPTSIVRLSAGELNRKSARFLVFTQPTVKRLWLTRPRVPLSPLPSLINSYKYRSSLQPHARPLHCIKSPRNEQTFV